MEIVNATKARIPVMKTNRIRWLHDGKDIERAKKNGRTRGVSRFEPPFGNLTRTSGEARYRNQCYALHGAGVVSSGSAQAVLQLLPMGTHAGVVWEKGPVW